MGKHLKHDVSSLSISSNVSANDLDTDNHLLAEFSFYFETTDRLRFPAWYGMVRVQATSYREAFDTIHEHSTTENNL